jgi:hypothetical protein
MTSEEPPDASMIEDVDDFETGPNCPSCGYAGLEYDGELRAYVHDWCGYLSEETEQEDDDLDDYGGWLD